MNEPQSQIRRHATVPLVALAIASAACVVLVTLRVLWSGHPRYFFLLGNLFLAWLPLAFAWRACGEYQSDDRRWWKLCAFAGLWLLFFPNAPYIFTDVVHLNGWFRTHYWVDLTLILLVAFTGFMAGFLSLYLMQSAVVNRAGRPAGWLFVLMVTGLSGVGIYIGRFLRWNSWDVLLNPLDLTRDVARVAVHPIANAGSLAFCVLFAAFLFFGYLMLYALTHLQPAQARGARTVH